ncbi:MAG TPA: hypothetical protein VFO70_08330 [Chitinophagaceae bacterium]|nr:hypothetical protein [Chitinophagaceae bacterium]
MSKSKKNRGNIQPGTRQDSSGRGVAGMDEESRKNVIHKAGKSSKDRGDNANRQHVTDRERNRDMSTDRPHRQEPEDRNSDE